MNKTQDITMTEQDIIDYLKNNPKFLQQNPDLVDYLLPPKDKSGGRKVADFQHYMVEKLKADKKMVLDTTRDIIEVSRENMNNLARIHSAVLKLLEAQSFDEFMQILSVDVPVMLDCDAVSLIVVDEGNQLPQTTSRWLKKTSAQMFDQWMDGNDVRIQSNIQGSEAVFGEASGLVKSQALIKINQTMDIVPAVIAFGSRDPEMFVDGQGADLIAFLCQCTERMIKTWMQ